MSTFKALSLGMKTCKRCGKRKPIKGGKYNKLANVFICADCCRG